MNEIHASSVGRSRHSKYATTQDPLTAFQDRLSVARIATPRHALHTCRSDETMAEVMARNDKGFDYLPVIDAAQHSRKQIIGLVELVPYLRGKVPEGIVDEKMCPLFEAHLIGANAGMLTFVKP